MQPPLPTSYENVLGTTTSVGSVRRLGDERPSVSDQQIKRWALEAYDQPGQCFYVSLMLLQREYSSYTYLRVMIVTDLKWVVTILCQIDYHIHVS